MKSARLISLVFATSVLALGSTWAQEGVRISPGATAAVGVPVQSTRFQTRA